MPDVKRTETAIPTPCAARPLLTVDEAAERLRVTRWRMYELARCGEIPGVVRLGRRQLRFDADAIERFICGK